MDLAWAAIALAVASGVATSPDPAAEPACALRGFVPAPRARAWRPCDQLEQGCWLGDHRGYFQLREWLAPHPIGYWFRSNAADLDGDGRIDCFTAVLAPDGWRIEARRGQMSCVQGETFHPSAAYVMSRHLHAAAGPTAPS